jgi:hypothetical protein
LERRYIFRSPHANETSALGRTTTSLAQCIHVDEFRRKNPDAYYRKSDFKAAAENIDTVVKVTITIDGKKKKVTAPGLIKRRAEESAPFRVLPTANATN